LGYGVITFKYLNAEVQRTQMFTHNYQVSSLFPSFSAKKNKTFRKLNPFSSSRKKGGGDAELGSTQTALFND
jgi:hypothetical protein